MKKEPMPEENGYRVWLSDTEQEQLSEFYEEEPVKQLSIKLMLNGLRRQEALNVTLTHVREMNTEEEGYMLVIPHGKTGYRECPIPSDDVSLIKMLKNVKGISKDETLIDVNKRTVLRWVNSAADELADRNNEPDWKHVSPHDLRRTWATHLYWNLDGQRARDIVMSFGGWVDVQTFSNNYLGSIPDSIAIDVMNEANLR